MEQWTFTSDDERIASAGALPAAGRLEMPADWSPVAGPDFVGRVRHRRFFNRPTGLVPGKRVWLVCEGASERAVAVLNETRLGEITGATSPARFDITDRLAPRNELIIDVEFSARCPDIHQASNFEPRACRGLTGEVRLEIEE